MSTQINIPRKYIIVPSQYKIVELEVFLDTQTIVFTFLDKNRIHRALHHTFTRGKYAMELVLPERLPQSHLRIEPLAPCLGFGMPSPCIMRFQHEQPVIGTMYLKVFNNTTSVLVPSGEYIKCPF